MKMDQLEKLSFAASAACFEMDGDALRHHREPARQRPSAGYTRAQMSRKYGAGWEKRQIEVDGRMIPVENAVMPNGRRLPLLKAMLTTACERDCYYCTFRAGHNIRRVTFTADRMAETYFRIYSMGKVDGLFLSAGILGGGANSQNKLIETAEILRNRHGYTGYLHLKIMPGIEREQINKAMQFADRVSVNLEAPSQNRLSRIAPTKQFKAELLESILWIEKLRRTEPRPQGTRQRWPSSTTQFVVGAADESDLEILNLVSHLYHQAGLSRVYFEAFDPIPGTPLENLPAENPLREHRLYQASFLLRDYGFEFEDLPFDNQGDLPLERDPKLVYAQSTLSHAPIEINRADRRELLRVPGIGPKGAAAIVRLRRLHRFREIGELRKIGILSERAAPYITLDGRKPAQQLTLF